MYQLPASPQLVGGVLDSALGLYKASFRAVIGLAVFASLVTSVPGLFDDRLDRMLAGDFTQIGVPVVGLLVGSLLGLAVGLFIGMAAIARMTAVAGGGSLALGAALSVAARSFPTAVVYAVTVTLAMMALIAPAAALAVAGLVFLPLLLVAVPVGLALLVATAALMLYWYFGVFLIVGEGLGPFAAMRRSFVLVRGHWWRTCAILIVAWFIQLAVMALVAAVSAAISALASGGLPSIAALLFVINVVSGAVVTPFLFAVSIAALWDLRLRRDGADLARRLDAAQA